MLRNDEFFSCISEKHTLALLDYLKDQESPLMLKDLQKITNHTQTLRKRIDEMERDGLVSVEMIYSPHKSASISLTTLGMEVCLIMSLDFYKVSPDTPMRDKSICQKYADPILRMLNRNAYLTQTDIMKVIPSYRTVIRTIAMMEDDGLLISEENREGSKNIRYSLTPFGKHIADGFQLIYDKIRR